ncbi:MAG: transcription-repair coupling factor [Deltaproteobacteria bacterium]|nr:transcription-repair coupling factor [Deltaproteobacteria bacterium]
MGNAAGVTYVRMAPLSGIVYALCQRIGKGGDRAVLVVPGKREGEEALVCAETFLGSGHAHMLSHYELNPYEASSPDPNIVARRIETLFAVMEGRCRLLVSTAEAFSAFTAPPTQLRNMRFGVERGTILDREALLGWLVGAGFQRIPEVSDPGDFAVRGGIVDVFSPAVKLPVRLEFAGDVIESIRLFDPSSQRTVKSADAITLYPASEIVWPVNDRPLTEDPLPGGVEDFLSAGVRFPGIEFFMPRIYGKRGAALDYFKGPPHVVIYDYAEVKKRQQFLAALARDIFRKGEEGLPAPEELFSEGDGAGAKAKGQTLTLIDNFFNRPAERELFGIDISSPGGPSHPRRSPLQLKGALSLIQKSRKKGMRCCIVVPSPYRLDVMRRIMEENGVHPLSTIEDGRGGFSAWQGVALATSGMKSGFISNKGAILVITDHDIWGKRTYYRDYKPSDPEKERIGLLSLRKEDYVVHDDYGIGLFAGLKTMKVGGNTVEFAVIEYDGGDLLYLPTYRLDLIQKYVGGDGKGLKLDRLGARRWELAKRRVREKVEQVAAELLSIHAEREASEGFACDPPDAAFEEFAAGFEFEETPDQERAIGEVIENMTNSRPMDRLVCGDVGYGKTEVGLRAAFLAVMAGKQVAVLCPTTVLAQQHFKTFRERFENFPVRVASLSRFVKSKEQRTILQELAGGRLDILIGTHRLLQGDVIFRDLGLLVIDEEQKFGVMHKEKLKKMRTTVDVLTLSATPIPRTFHIALSGIKDISIIQTPPKERLSVRTFVVEFSEEIIREGIGRELRRGGQVYYIHNRIQTIGKTERFLRELFPEARIEVAHGQMGEDALKGVMRRFYGGGVDVLLCTAIVESGLDIPRANTMIVDRSHTFGLAQLYQLRGRIGRDRRRAYAYLIVPPRKALSPEAVARLSAIEELSELGSGFQIASYDLDIRGGGDIIGPSQSGHIQHVGYEMYLRFLEDAVARLKGKSPGRKALPDAELGVPVFIPDEYIHDPQRKLDFYRKIALVRSDEDYDEVFLELTDRFGALPEPVFNLLRIARLRSLLSREGVRELKASEGRIHVSFDADAAIDRNHIAGLVARKGEKYGFDRRGILVVRTEFDGTNWDRLVSDMNAVLGGDKLEGGFFGRGIANPRGDR